MNFKNCELDISNSAAPFCNNISLQSVEEVVSPYLKETTLPGESRQHVMPAKSNHGYKSNFKLVKAWEGYVVTIDDNNITAKLYDAEDNSYDIYHFDTSEVALDDIKLVQKGALFFLYLGYLSTGKGPIYKSSYVAFRRFPKQQYIDDALDSMNEDNYSDIWE